MLNGIWEATWVWVLAATFGCTRLAGRLAWLLLAVFVGVSGIFVEFVAAAGAGGGGRAQQRRQRRQRLHNYFSRAFGVGIRLALCNK